MTSTVGAVHDRLRDHRDDMVELLAALVEEESPSTVPESQPGPQRLLADALAELDYRSEIVPGESTGGYLLAQPAGGGGGPRQLLVGHSDTVWPLGTLTSRPVELADGIFRGPGSYDAKAGLVQAIFCLRVLTDMDLEAPLVPLVFVNADEEIGSRDSGQKLADLARGARRAFVLEPSLGPEGRLKTARKGLGRFTVRVRGRAAHAGLDPGQGASSILELSHVVQTLFELNEPSRGITVNVGTVEGGVRPNVVAPEASAVIDVRVLYIEDAEGVEAAIRGLTPVTPGTSIEVEGRFGRPPMERTAGNASLFDRARRIGGELGLDLDEATAGGGSDGNTTSLFVPTLDGMGAVGGGAHAHDEHVVVDALVDRAAVLAGLLLEPEEG